MLNPVLKRPRMDKCIFSSRGKHDWLFTIVYHVQTADDGPLLLHCTIILISHRSSSLAPYYVSQRLTRREISAGGGGCDEKAKAAQQAEQQKLDPYR